MTKRGRVRIVMVDSPSSYVGSPERAHYTAAKHVLVGLMKALGVELAPLGVNVSMCARAPEIRPWSQVSRQARITQLENLTGTCNLFDPTQMLAPEVSHAVVWLASDAARFVTGASMAVDAGFTPSER